MVKTTRNSAVKARTQTINQLHSLLVTAPALVRETLAGLRTAQLITTCADWDEATPTAALTNPDTVACHALGVLARRAQALHAEAARAKAILAHLVPRAAPGLLDLHGVGPETAATLLMTAGDNPARLHTEAGFAALCGASPIPASSGITNRHRLNRGGDRQANAALHRIVVVRLRNHEPTRAYLARRISEGKTKREAIRCLKRYLIREIYRALPIPAAA